MKRSNQILLVVGFLIASLLGGLLATLLRPERAEAAPLASFGTALKLTVLPVSFKSMPVTPQAFKVGDIGPVIVQDGSSLIEAAYQGALAPPAGSSATFQLRVDDLPPVDHTGTCLVVSTNLQCTFIGYWQSLPAGLHTVSVWVTNTANNSGSVAAGGLDSDVVMVKEYLPFGATYIPLVQK